MRLIEDNLLPIN